MDIVTILSLFVFAGLPIIVLYVLIRVVTGIVKLFGRVDRLEEKVKELERKDQ